MVSFNKKNTGQGALQGNDRDSSRTSCESMRMTVGREEPLHVVPCSAFPDTVLKSVRERLFVVSPSLMVLLPRTVRMQEATQAQGRCALHSFWCEESPEPHVCVTTLSLLLGFEVVQALAYVFFLYSHMMHTGKELHRSGFPMQRW